MNMVSNIFSVGKISIESICSNTETDAEFGYIKGPGTLTVDGRTQCDCALTTSPYRYNFN